MSSGKYNVAKSDADRSGAGKDSASGTACCDQVKENFLTPGFEPVRPDRSNWIYTGVFIVLGAIALVAGRFSGRATIQGMEVYSIQVKSTDGQVLSMLGVQTLYEIAQLYLPGDNFFDLANVTTPYSEMGASNVPKLSSTQSLLDFRSGWNVVIDLKSDICYIQPMNTTKMATRSFEEFKKALVQDGGYVVSTVTSVNKMGWSARKATNAERSALSSYVSARCKDDRTFRLEKTGKTFVREGCVESFLPEYALRRFGDKDLVYLIDVKIVPKTASPNCTTVIV